MTSDKISALVIADHKEDAVEVPFDHRAALGTKAVSFRAGRRGHAVVAQIADHAFDTFIVARSSRYWLLLPPEGERAVGIAAGRRVDVTLGLPTSPANAIPR